VLNENQFLMIY